MIFRNEGTRGKALFCVRIVGKSDQNAKGDYSTNQFLTPLTTSSVAYSFRVMLMLLLFFS
jgi:hypothetical protein